MTNTNDETTITVNFPIRDGYSAEEVKDLIEQLNARMSANMKVVSTAATNDETPAGAATPAGESNSYIDERIRRAEADLAAAIRDAE
ncbi:hypothetical protein, partial [Corynebacterium pygosceleis]|uniref:hypothetical protein n=1 Tax=Corynebacterium pygosceleis TaxID=2800406 RepID=UPI002006415E